LNAKLFLYFFITSSILTTVFILAENQILEFTCKIFSIVSLLCYYINSTHKINNYYLAVLIISCAFPYLFLNKSTSISEMVFLYIGSGLIAINKILYSIISLNSIRKQNLKLTLNHIIILLIYIAPIFIILPLIESFLKDFLVTAILIGIISSLMCYLSFLKFLSSTTKGNLFFLIGLTLLVVVEIFYVYNKFVSKNIYIILSYQLTTFIARLLICEAMIDRKQKSLSN